MLLLNISTELKIRLLFVRVINDSMKNYHSALWIVIINVLVFAVQIFSAGFTESFLLFSPDLLSRPWILVTSMFLHGSVMHLLGNMFALGVFGMVFEQFVGTKRFLAIYVVSGMLTGFVSSFFYESALGASGAIFGVLGALAITRPRMIVWTYGAPMPMIIAAFFWLFLDTLGAFYPSNVANAAHIAGLMFGFAAGFAFLDKETKQQKRKRVLSEEEINEWEDEWM